MRVCRLPGAGSVGAGALCALVLLGTLGCGVTDRYAGWDQRLPDDTPIEKLVIEGEVLAEPGRWVTCPAGAFVAPEWLHLRAECVDQQTGRARDVTGVARWSVDDPRYALSNNAQRPGTFSFRCPLPYALRPVVIAEADCGRATAEVQLGYVAPDVVPDDKFSVDAFALPLSPDPLARPRLLYPLDGALHPPSVDRLTVQWSAPTTQTLFRLAFAGEYIQRRVYLRGDEACVPDPSDRTQALCQYPLPAPVALSIVHSGWGKDISLVVRGAHLETGFTADSEPVTLRTSTEPLEGTLYHGAKSVSGIRRVRFPDATVDTVLDGNRATGCVGCHAVSHDGKRLAATAAGYDGVGVLVDTETGAFLRSPDALPPQRWNHATFSPNDLLLVTSFGGKLTLRDGRTGERKADIDPALVGGRAIQPAWSPDGTRLAFVRLPKEGMLGGDFPGSKLVAGDFAAANTGDLAVMKFDGQQFSPAELLQYSSPGGEYYHSPSWSPDGEFLIFVVVSAPGNAPLAWERVYGQDPVPPAYRDSVMTYGQAASRLCLLRLERNTWFELEAATHSLGRGVTSPRFVGNRVGEYAYFTFTAHLPYGFVGDGSRSQLWLSGVDLRGAPFNMRPADSSAAPLWLPYQDARDDNYGATWQSGM